MKKKLALLLVSVLALTQMTACGSGGSNSSASSTSASDNSSVSSPTTSSSGSSASSSTAPAATTQNEIKVVTLYTQNLGSQSFVDVIDRGCKRAAEELGIQYSSLESLEVANAPDAVRAAIIGGANLVIASAASFNDALMTLAVEFPDVKFCSIDSDGATITEYLPNIYEVTYREHEAAFLQGAFCALMSKTGQVAQLQGMEGGVLDRFNAGFRAGVRYVLDVDPITVVVGFSDVNKGYETAIMLYDQGYDWLACCAGGSNLGVFQASEEKGGDYWVCGAADGQFHLMPSRVVASQVKTIDDVAYDVCAMAVNGTFPGGTSVQLGVKEGGVNLIFTDMNEDLLKMVPQEVMDTINQLRQDITEGKLVVPSAPAELDSFTTRMEK